MADSKAVLHYAKPKRLVEYWSYPAFYRYSFTYVIAGMVVTIPTAAIATISLLAPSGRTVFADLLFPCAAFCVHYYNPLLLVLITSLVQFPL